MGDGDAGGAVAGHLRLKFQQGVNNSQIQVKSKAAYGDDADPLSYRLLFRFLRF